MATPAAIREHYDSLALIYRSFWGDHLHHGLFLRGDESPQEAQLNLVAYCLQAACPGGEPAPGTRVLDVGCGHGATAVYLARRYACLVQGMTVSEKQVRLAREHAMHAGVSQLTEFVLGDADCHSFPARSFDLIWTMESSEHFRDKPAYFRRVASALRPGGSLLLAAWTGSTEKPRVRAVAQAFLCPSLHSAEQYSSHLQAAGLRLRHQSNLTAQVIRTWEICRQRVQVARAAVCLLPRNARGFVQGIDLILEAYRCGDLSYTVLAAEL